MAKNTAPAEELPEYKKKRTNNNHDDDKSC